MSEDKKKAMPNVQRHAYQLTQNNPLEHGLDHLIIRKILVEEFKTLQFFAMADEVSKTGTPHTHIYVFFSSRVRWNKLKKAFPDSHIEIAKSSPQNNVDYIRKTGKWENTDKQETSIRGTYEEWGTMPTQKGRKLEMQELFQLIKAGYSNAEILEINNDYIENLHLIERVRTTLLLEKYKNHRRLNLRCIYVYGATGTGKTRKILDRHGDSNVYRVNDYVHAWDSYQCQKIISLDEFRNSLSLKSMLQICDIYPIDLMARYSNKVMCAETIYIVSNWSLEMQYQHEQQHDRESWLAFLRRIHEVQVYERNGTIQTYDSVESYMNRNTNFHTLSESEQQTIPFERGKE